MGFNGRGGDRPLENKDNFEETRMKRHENSDGTMRKSSKLNAKFCQ